MDTRSRAGSPTFQFHLKPGDLVAMLRHDAAEGLARPPRSLPSKWFYDERGSRLFDAITRTPEYYLTRCERQILESRAGEIASITRTGTLVEIGSGTSDKTRLLLEAMRTDGSLERFMPFDVDPSTLATAATSIGQRFPSLQIHGIVGDFEEHLGSLPSSDRRTVAFLGSTIGNLPPQDRRRFFRGLHATARSGEWLLLGVDLVKDPSVIEAAYNDEQGLSAEFNKNVLRVIDNAFGAQFDPGCFSHRAVWDPDEGWMSMSLRSKIAHKVDLGDLGLVIDLSEGEEIHTEISAKFTRSMVEAELEASGWSLDHWWTDDRGWFGLTLARAL